MTSFLKHRGGAVFMLTAATVLAVTIAISAVPDVAAKAQPKGIWPPDQKYHGQYYGEWAADWWTWLIETEGAALLDDSGADCDVAQHGHGNVWYLAGSWVGPVERDCTVPKNKAFFFPIQNLAYLGYEDDPWPYYPHADEAAARASLADDNDNSGGRSAFIDGEEVEDLDQYRVTSPVFGATWPGWQYLYPCVDDGWYLLVKPLSVGEHTISFTGWDGDQDVTYNITVVDD